MSDPLYRKELLRLAADAHGAGRLVAPNATGIAFNPACGDRVIVDLVIHEGRVAEMAHDTKACVLAQASASVLGLAVKGADNTDIAGLLNRVSEMLASGSGVPGPPFDAYAAFSGALEYGSRHRCVLLPIEAVLSAFNNSH